MDTTIFIKKIEHDILFLQAYVDNIMFGAINELLCMDFSDMAHNEFEMSMTDEL